MQGNTFPFWNVLFQLARNMIREYSGGFTTN